MGLDKEEEEEEVKYEKLIKKGGKMADPEKKVSDSQESSLTSDEIEQLVNAQGSVEEMNQLEIKSIFQKLAASGERFVIYQNKDKAL